MGISLTGVVSIIHLRVEMPIFPLNYFLRGEIRIPIIALLMTGRNITNAASGMFCRFLTPCPNDLFDIFIHVSLYWYPLNHLRRYPFFLIIKN
jgi:hypothetical protein